jgi:hypothetical protein
VSENRVLRRIFVPWREEMTGGWRLLHNAKEARRIKLAWHVAGKWGEEKCI